VSCSEATAALTELVQTRIEGLTTVKKQPAKGWRDAVKLYATAFGVLGMGAAGALLSRSAVGFLLGPAFGVFGYSKQFWTTVFKRRSRLGAVPWRERPAGDALVGVARRFERIVGTDAIAIATTIASVEGVIARAIEAVPFWLELPDRRVLVAGACWVAGTSSERDVAVARALAELGASELPIALARKKLRVVRVTIAPGDRVAVIGRVREEQLPGVAGYRDALVETTRGEPGALVWIDRLDSAIEAPGRTA
jgi:hypothetical protein